MSLKARNTVLGVMCVFVVAAAGSCATRATRIPHMSMSSTPGELQKESEAKHPELHSATTEWPAPPPCQNARPPEISEISIERTSCYGYCPTDTLRLFADGSVRYRGQANVEQVGLRTGRIDAHLFENLAMLAEDIGLFQLPDNFDCMVTDNPTVFVSIVRAGVRKTIRHYAPGRTGPPRLRMFEEVVENLLTRVKWDRTGQ
jgi:hypothetical protein